MLDEALAGIDAKIDECNLEHRTKIRRDFGPLAERHLAERYESSRAYEKTVGSLRRTRDRMLETYERTRSEWQEYLDKTEELLARGLVVETDNDLMLQVTEFVYHMVEVNVTNRSDTRLAYVETYELVTYVDEDGRTRTERSPLRRLTRGLLAATVHRM